MADNDKILEEARERFQRCQEWENAARINWQDDYRFGHGNETNNWQWDDGTYATRTRAGKPCFTINRTQPYCDQIINSALQDKASVTVRPVGGGATYDSAVILEGIVRHIEYISNAQLAYEKATTDQVYGGIGWWRVVTDYADNKSFDQEIFVRPIHDALSVYIDPYIEQSDGSDATFGFVFTDMDKHQFDKQNPKFKNIAASASPLATVDQDGITMADRQNQNRVRLVEYFRKVTKTDTLHYLDNGQTIRESEAKENDAMDALKRHSVDNRDIETTEVEYYKIAGDQIIEKGIWPGKYIPLIRVIGKEIIVDGQLDRTGHVRNLKDGQRLLNYNVSAGVHFVSIQTMSPWTADVRSIAGLEEYYKTAHLVPHGVLPFKSIGDDGQPIPPEALPRRIDPPAYAPAFMDGQKTAIENMELISGQPPAVMGQESNERSGKAIQERQRSASNSTYHFVNNLANAVRFTGKILIDLIPKIYDTPRIMKILGQDGTQHTIQIDPNQEQAHQQLQGLDEESFDPQQIAAIFNPSVGEYDVVAEVGPNYTTRREQFVSATMDLMAQNESLAPYVVDLVFGQMDFPGSKQIAQRMRNVVAAMHPEALGQNGDPQLVQAQKQIAMQAQNIQALQGENQQLKDKRGIELLQKDIDQQNADTNRLKVVNEADPDLAKAMFRQMADQVFQDSIHDIMQSHAIRDAITQAIATAINPGKPDDGSNSQ